MLKPLLVLLLLALAGLASAAEAPWAELGQALFFDTNLSQNRTQSCATCHDPARAFTDPRPGLKSLGDDGHSLSDRNTPTLSYIGSSPDFTFSKGEPFGGFFVDGRAPTLAEQAIQPILNPKEMGLTDEAALRTRLLENPYYASALQRLDPCLSTAGVVGKALVAFQQSEMFSPADSKYDRFLRGEYEMTPKEEEGRLLFFSDLLSCAGCHELEGAQPQTFTDFRYHNIGTPSIDGTTDLGLAERDEFSASIHRGKFKTPTLRNVSVTSPYMHNGVFKELRTVLEFYNKYFLAGTLNPETQRPWAEPAVPENINKELLTHGQPIDVRRMESLLAFLHTLTDRRYEHLISR